MHAARRHCAPPTVTAQTCTVLLLRLPHLTLNEKYWWRAENKSEHVTSQSDAKVAVLANTRACHLFHMQALTD